ncbi:MAG TPA: helix-turn-helix transcriptional regulator, partial [Pyrinomonadaceae bacterium]|nr:helix-turn-helix transcriptional regulator [Pyrinomonadaceae bacterium]
EQTLTTAEQQPFTPPPADHTPPPDPTRPGRASAHMNAPRAPFHVMAVDCCEHVLSSLGLRLSPPGGLTEVSSAGGVERAAGRRGGVDLIVVGVSRYPVRRFFLSQLRRVYSEVPVLLLRRTGAPRGADEHIRGEFILSDARGGGDDLRVVSELRPRLPFEPCAHTHRGVNYQLVREVVRVITEHYTDPQLDLARVARVLAVSPLFLSRLLNQKVGVSFRQLLRHARIEEAKRMLSTRRYSVKEVSERVGFSDSHYFSRSFRQLTGQSASEYQSQDAIFG